MFELADPDAWRPLELMRASSVAVQGHGRHATWARQIPWGVTENNLMFSETYSGRRPHDRKAAKRRKLSANATPEILVLSMVGLLGALGFVPLSFCAVARGVFGRHASHSAHGAVGRRQARFCSRCLCSILNLFIFNFLLVVGLRLSKRYHH
jgi:hypothetical protein